MYNIKVFSEFGKQQNHGYTTFIYLAVNKVYETWIQQNMSTGFYFQTAMNWT